MPSEDPRVVEARKLHKSALKHRKSAAADQAARDERIRSLRADGWTQDRIAEAIGCSPSLVRIALRRS